MLTTPLCRTLGITAPVFSVGMGALAGPALAAAVSNAGAYLRRETPPGPRLFQWRPAAQVLTPYIPYLIRHWHECGAHTGSVQLWRDIQPLGYTYSARGLQDDLIAVKAGLTLTWSNGVIEGQIHRLKLLKRQGYGRAGFALLRQRVLQAA
jgi:hypothetical protein